MGIRKAAKLLTVAQVPAGTNVLDRFPPQPVRGGKHLAHSVRRIARFNGQPRRKATRNLLKSVVHH